MPRLSETVNISAEKVNYSRVTGFIRLTKPRLSMLVVFSAVITYCTVADVVKLIPVLALCIGGFLVTGAANGFNQVIETNLDKLMNRTMNRPLPLAILQRGESLVFCIITGLTGVLILWFFLNLLSAVLGLLSILLYAWAYTPMKRKSPFSVMVGAIPGAMPTLIGAVAASSGYGNISYYAFILFFIQFMWQFPHFWAIAWVSHDDYQKAGFFMLPSLGGRDQSSGFQILVYTLFLIPVSIIPFAFQFTGPYTTILIFILGIWFFMLAYKVYKTCSIEAARKLMFASFIYLPLVQIILLIGTRYKI